jgi:hypothetical protein
MGSVRPKAIHSYALSLALVAACASADTSGGTPDAQILEIPDAPSTRADAVPGTPDAGPPGPDSGPSADASPTGTLTVVAPNGGESLSGGDDIQILWSSSGAVSTVDIALHKNGAKVLDIITGAANTGMWPWTVPIDLVAGTDYTVVITERRCCSPRPRPRPTTRCSSS